MVDNTVARQQQQEQDAAERERRALWGRCAVLCCFARLGDSKVAVACLFDIVSILCCLLQGVLIVLSSRVQACAKIYILCHRHTHASWHCMCCLCSSVRQAAGSAVQCWCDTLKGGVCCCMHVPSVLGFDGHTSCPQVLPHGHGGCVCGA